MSIISLTTDWHYRDYYLGALKGRLLSYCPMSQIVDISHKVTNYNIAQAAFILKNAFKHFPKGSLHIVGINSESTEAHPHIALKYDGHFFIGADNGIFSLMFKDQVKEMVHIDNVEWEEEYRNFPELNIFSKAARHIFEHKSLAGLGSKHKELYRLIPIRAVIQKGTIYGRVIYIDSYQNAVTNISRELFQSVQQERDFEILVQSNHYKITRINKDYHETDEGEILALFNSAGLLEISLNKGKLAELLQLDTNSDVRIKFYDS